MQFIFNVVMSSCASALIRVDGISHKRVQNCNSQVKNQTWEEVFELSTQTVFEKVFIRHRGNELLNYLGI